MKEDQFDNPKDMLKDVLKNGLFSQQKLTKGEIINIIFVVILILVMIFIYFNTKCTLDCSMCSNTAQIITQGGFL